MDDREQLLTRVAMGEGSAREESRVREMEASDPAVAQEMRALRDTFGALARAHSSEEPEDASAGEVPGYILARLERARDKAFASAEAREGGEGMSFAFWAIASLWLRRAAVVAAVALFVGGPATLWWRHHGAQGDLDVMGVRGTEPTTTLGQPVPFVVFAPSGTTRYTQPLFLWRNQPERTYAIWMTLAEPGSKEVWRAEGQRSPVPLATLGGPALEPGKTYRATIRPEGGKAVDVSFAVAPDAAGAPPRLDAAKDVLAEVDRLENAGFPGDALMVLRAAREEILVDHEVQAKRRALEERLVYPRGTQ